MELTYHLYTHTNSFFVEMNHGMREKRERRRTTAVVVSGGDGVCVCASWHFERLRFWRAHEQPSIAICVVATASSTVCSSHCCASKYLRNDFMGRVLLYSPLSRNWLSVSLSMHVVAAGQ